MSNFFPISDSMNFKRAISPSAPSIQVDKCIDSILYFCFEGVRVLTPYNPSREGYRVRKRRSCLKRCRHLGGQKVIKKINLHEGTDVFDVFRRVNFWQPGSVNSVTNWPSATCFFLKTFFCKNQTPQPNSRIFSLQGRVWRGRLY